MCPLPSSSVPSPVACSTRDYSALGEQVFCAFHYLEIIKRSSPVALAQPQEQQTLVRAGAADDAAAVERQQQPQPEQLLLDEENSLSQHREEGSLLDGDTRPSLPVSFAPVAPSGRPVATREPLRSVGTVGGGALRDSGLETDEQMMQRVSGSRSFKDIRAVFERESLSSVEGAPMGAAFMRRQDRREDVDLETAPTAARNALDYFHRLETRAAAVAPNAQPLINFD